MKNKAQITIFAIIGIVILFLFLTLFVVYSDIDIRFRNTDEVEEFADFCFQTAGICLLERLGEAGGNLEFDENIPSLEDIASNSEEYFIKAAELCQNGFKDVNAVVIAEKINPAFLFNPLDTIIDVDQKLTVRRQQESKTFNRFATKLKIRFQKSHELANQLKENKLTLIDDSYINTNLLETEAFDVNIYQDEDVVIVLTDKDSIIKDQNYKFAFVK